MSLQHGSNSFYPKFLIETSRSAPPPCRETARLAEKLPLLILICARHQKILLKGKGNFSARLCPQPFGQGGGASLPARARRNSPHTPLLPRPRLGGEKFLRRSNPTVMTDVLNQHPLVQKLILPAAVVFLFPLLYQSHICK